MTRVTPTSATRACKTLTRKRLAVGFALCAAAALPSAHACSSPLRQDPLVRATRAPEVDSDLELARAFAPWILHAVHPRRGRQDIPAAVDFDGDQDGENDWEHLPRFELVPTVYYACLASETHWFLTYHVHHPRDWSLFEVGLHLTHEGDGENLQVVVDRATGSVVLLFAQAHYRGRAYAAPGSGFAARTERLAGGLLLVDDEGRVAPDGRHAVVYVQSGGHGIYGALDRCAPVATEDGRLRAAGNGIALRPARAGEEVGEPTLQELAGFAAEAPYRLESTTRRLWPLLRDGTLVGEGRLLDGTVPYADERVSVELPRYYEADRFSGPFGPDRGISPFAVDFDFEAPTLGSLFFDPARRWAEVLHVPTPWSLEWIDYPFGGTRDRTRDEMR